MNFKFALRSALETVGLLEASRTLKQKILYWTSPSARYWAIMRQAQERRLVTFSRRYAETLGCGPGEAGAGLKRALVLGSSTVRVELDLCLIKALELAGCPSVPLVVEQSDFSRKYYSLLGPMDVQFWSDVCDSASFHTKAESIVHDCHSLDELLDVRFGAARVGGYAVATARRKLKTGTLDLQLPSVRGRLIECLATAIASAAAAKRIVQELQPSLVLTDDTANTPRGEILDTCVENGIPVIRWFPAHNGSALMLKRYTSANRDHDLNSLSDVSWRAVREMDWSSNLSEELQHELSACYARGNWYSEAGTQFDKRLLEVDAVRQRLGVDPSKKTAFIFPHVSWDASFGRGQDLFESYDEWFVETVRAACANDKLNWVVKIHPAHVMKSLGGGRRRPAEEDTLRLRIGRLPPHVSLLSAGSDISTFSLFPVMDYCLTVRGTAGLEAACRGIPVLTGGNGRYDRKGFTIDSATPRQYLEWIAHIQDIPRLSPAQIELAERYAYGLFLLRPLSLSSVTLEYDKKYGQENFFNRIQIHLRTRKDWEEAPDLRAFADWATKSDEQDFLQPVPPD
jgi:hypothetical protein